MLMLCASLWHSIWKSCAAREGAHALQIARGVIGLVVTGHYPLNHHPGRLAIEHLEQYCFGWKEISQWFSYLQSILFVASTTAVAVVVRPLSPLAPLSLRSLVYGPGRCPQYPLLCRASSLLSPLLRLL